LENKLRVQLILKAKNTDKSVALVNKIGSTAGENLKLLSKKYEELNVVEDNFSPNESKKTDKVNLSETTPIVTVSEETIQVTQENVLPIAREKDLSKEEKEEIKAKTAELTNSAKTD
jgi:hypothetical protein